MMMTTRGQVAVAAQAPTAVMTTMKTRAILSGYDQDLIRLN
jgi:hypothetical protein